MPTIEWVERQVQRVEGFAIRFLWPTGIDVRGDKQNIPSYPFERGARNDETVEQWKASRFRPTYPGFDVEVLTADRSAAQGNTRLFTVRDSFK
ncbi:MAG TPA: hypothetical protein VLV48_04115 [Thermoanaerobaculia bacterium]|nr:hypothetical protein [Thermoanaerobaculia bacterium]